MVTHGWDHHQLCEMSEDEFLWWLEQRLDLDEQIAEQQRKQQEGQS